MMALIHHLDVIFPSSRAPRRRIVFDRSSRPTLRLSKPACPPYKTYIEPLAGVRGSTKNGIVTASVQIWRWILRAGAN